MDKTKVSVSSLQAKKRNGQKITMLTAYDYPFGKIIDQAGIDIVFISDVMGMTGLGYRNTLSVTMEDMIHHTKAVANGVKRAFLLACMPFMEYNTEEDARRNARWFIKEGGADGVEIEGEVNGNVVEITKAIVDAGIPTMVHIGLTKMFASRYGRFQVIGRTTTEAAGIIELAIECQEAGAFAISVECVPDRVSKIITETLKIPVIGIGAGIYCDGQALVTQDIIGLFEQFVPKFVKRYVNLWEETLKAVKAFIEEVENSKFPTLEHQFKIDEDELIRLKKLAISKNWSIIER
jgi:3-methyl-2-oxobutanoate hydroxymethyltransferase